MALDQRLHGKNGRLQMDTTGGSSVVTLGDVNSFTIDMGTDRSVVTAFGDANVRRVAGLPDFSGTLGAWWNAVASSSPAYFEAVLAGNPVTLRLIPNINDPTVYFQGLANVDGALAVSSTAPISTTGKWDAAGNWDLLP